MKIILHFSDISGVWWYDIFKECLHVHFFCSTALIVYEREGVTI
jgi:hypothetical protein